MQSHPVGVLTKRETVRIHVSPKQESLAGDGFGPLHVFNRGAENKYALNGLSVLLSNPCSGKYAKKGTAEIENGDCLSFQIGKLEIFHGSFLKRIRKNGWLVRVQIAMEACR